MSDANHSEVAVFDIVNPPALGKPRGWNNGMLSPADARILFVAGQTARGPDGAIVSPDFVAQFGQCLNNVLHVVRAAGGEAEDIGRMTVFVTDRNEYLGSRQALGDEWKAALGRHYPAMALVIVTALVDDGAKVEIEATAAIRPVHP